MLVPEPESRPRPKPTTHLSLCAQLRERARETDPAVPLLPEDRLRETGARRGHEDGSDLPKGRDGGVPARTLRITQCFSGS